MTTLSVRNLSTSIQVADDLELSAIFVRIETVVFVSKLSQISREEQQLNRSGQPARIARAYTSSPPSSHTIATIWSRRISDDRRPACRPGLAGGMEDL